MDVSEQQCATLLSVWIVKNSSPEICKRIASDIGYNDSPLFGAKKKKTKLMGEVVILNTALVIYAVNNCFNEDKSKAIIDSFLSLSKKNIFDHLEKNDSDFKEKYSNRMSEYFKLLHQDKALLGITFFFMKRLDIDPLKKLKEQIALVSTFGGALASVFNILKTMHISKGSPLLDFEREISEWPEEQAKVALQVARDMIKSDYKSVADNFFKLTPIQTEALGRLMKRIDDSKNESAGDHPSNTEDHITEKLSKLKNLHQKGLITSDEFTKKKAEIISKL